MSKRPHHHPAGRKCRSTFRRTTSREVAYREPVVGKSLDLGFGSTMAWYDEIGRIVANAMALNEKPFYGGWGSERQAQGSRK